MNGLHNGHRVVRPPQTASDLLAVLGGGLRLEIIQHLVHGSLCVSELAERMALGMSHVSTNLRVLHEHDLITYRRRKLKHYYRISDRFKVTESDDGMILARYVLESGEGIVVFWPSQAHLGSTVAPPDVHAHCRNSDLVNGSRHHSKPRQR